MACSDSNAPAPTPTPTPQQDTHTFADEPWHPGVRLRRVGDAFAEHVPRVVVTPSGNIVALRGSRAEKGELPGVEVVEMVDPDGRMLGSMAGPPDRAGLDLVVHPSGELTLIELRPSASKNEKEVWLRRLGADLRTLREAPLRDRPSEHELLTYFLATQPDGSPVIDKVESRPAPADDIVRIDFVKWAQGHVRLAARGEEVLVGAWTYGTKVYALGADLEVRWSRQVMPESPSTVTVFFPEVLTVDEAGRIGIAFPVSAPLLEAYKRHFGREDIPPYKGPSYFQTMVRRITADGRKDTGRTFDYGDRADIDYLDVVGMALRGDEVTLCGSVRIKNKLHIPNQTEEHDLGWLHGNIEGGAVQARAADLLRQDYAHTCRVDAKGGLTFAGTNDFLQVDTNSWMEFGQALVYAVDAEGKETARITFRGPRHTEITTFDWTKRGAVVFGGTFDGPVTHTEDQRSNGMLGVLPPPEPR
ncbi:hypothetical protein [Pendulispora albinea]|uniref:Lipoprotein n=1 Tax=Pendulispora albinea TaxID=2741071 RepID=A0ABZ2LRL9_9BACT